MNKTQRKAMERLRTKERKIAYRRGADEMTLASTLKNSIGLVTFEVKRKKIVKVLRSAYMSPQQAIAQSAQLVWLAELVMGRVGEVGYQVITDPDTRLIGIKNELSGATQFFSPETASELSNRLRSAVEFVQSNPTGVH